MAGKTRSDYDRDGVLRIALAHLIQVIGEAARKVSPEQQAASPDIPWKAVMGMRHRIVHNYAEIDDDLVWKTIIEDLPPLIAALQKTI